MRHVIASIFLLSVFVGITTHQFFKRVEEGDRARTFLHQFDVKKPTAIEGKVVSYLTSSTDSLPDYFLLRGPHGILFQVSISTVASKGVAQYIIERSVKYGDVVRITGFLAAAGGEMRWVNGAHIRMSPRSLEMLSRDQVWNVRLIRSLYSVRAHIVETLISIFGAQHGGLLAGLIVEGGALIDSDTKKLFQKTGLSHIVALSGYNTSIIIDFSTLILGAMLPRRVRIISTGGLAVLFCVMTGASPPLLRASIMALCRLLADISYRRFNALRALTFSALCIAAYNPFLLFYSLSFQLSFLATLGLIVFARPLQGLCMRIMPKFIAQTFATTVAAQVYTLPLLIYRFHGLSIISFMANVVVLPIIPFLMLGAALSVGIASVREYVGAFAEFLTKLCVLVFSAALHALLWLVEWMAGIKYAYVYAALHPAWLGSIWIAGVIIGIWLMRRKRNEPLLHSS